MARPETGSHRSYTGSTSRLPTPRSATGPASSCSSCWEESLVSSLGHFSEASSSPLAARSSPGWRSACSGGSSLASCSGRYSSNGRDTMNHVNRLDTAPLFAPRDYEAPSLFTPQNLLREARRQKGLPEGPVPAICVFDPDGDLVEFLQAAGHAHRHPTWACYHTVLETFVQDEIEYGIIGRVVGAPFATLVAEELFASGCQLLISITSAGQLLPLGQPPYVILIDKALRDEGTSYHYLPPALREVVSA